MQLLWILLIIFAPVVHLLSMAPYIIQKDNQDESKTNGVEKLFFISEEEQTLPEEDLSLTVTEKVKRRILHALQLKEAPKRAIAFPALQKWDNVNESWTSVYDDQPEEYNGQNRHSDFLSSEIVPNTCFHRKGPQCIRFQIRLPQYVQQNEFETSEIWLYKRNAVTSFTIINIIDNFQNNTILRKSFLVNNQSHSQGWIRFDARHFLENTSSDILDLELYLDTPLKKLDIPIEIGRNPHQSGENRNPRLVILSEPKNTRSKRSTMDCESDDSACCAQSLYVSFKAIGWDHWIVRPDGYYANICGGSCRNKIDLACRYHTTVILRWIAKNSTQSGISDDSVHCTPKTYEPLPMIYTNLTGVTVISTLLDMSVSECCCS